MFHINILGHNLLTIVGISLPTTAILQIFGGSWLHGLVLPLLTYLLPCLIEFIVPLLIILKWIKDLGATQGNN